VRPHTRHTLLYLQKEASNPRDRLWSLLGVRTPVGVAGAVRLCLCKTSLQSGHAALPQPPHPTGVAEAADGAEVAEAAEDGDAPPRPAEGVRRSLQL
jgi:hypothetical protein